MSYFEEHYPCVRYPIQSDDDKGLRRAQLGAIHAIASYFTHSVDPNKLDSAIVVMPTGSGKTAVLILSAFVLKARKVLVITPSRLVRAQVTREFQSLEQLKNINALEGGLKEHKVHLLNSKLTTSKAWEDLGEYDVVVSTPNCTSPAYKDINPPPLDLFDVLLIDEAHHEPAKTWKALLDSFPNAKKILFTATPFRSDRKEIRGNIVYEFSIKEAYKDKIFGDIEFLPVTLERGESADIAIAQEAERVFKDDNSNGYQHFIMARTNTKKHAKLLKSIYQEYTKLNIRPIYSSHSIRYIDQTINKLRNNELDGIITVDMLGEGFDFPNLKIAAVHKPHKSLGITLQFIGRFARTNIEQIGQAKFIAIPQDIRIETEQLYKDGMVWQEIVPSLYESRVEREIRDRRLLSTFRTVTNLEDIVSEIGELSLYSLLPFNHVKVYRLSGDLDFNVAIKLDKMEVIRQEESDELLSIVLLARSINTPKWSTSSLLAHVGYELLVVYYDEKSHLLFINSSRRSDALYKSIASQVSVGRFEPLALCEINRVFLGIEHPEFYNIGMRNRIINNQTESYRIIAGSQAHLAINRSDGRLYNKGHLFGRGSSESGKITLGYSNTSKIWSNKSSNIPEFVNWCKTLASKITSDDNVITGSELDSISAGKRLVELPNDIWTVDWDVDVYLNSPRITYQYEQRTLYGQLLDLDLNVDRTDTGKNHLRILVNGPDLEWMADYSPLKYPFFQEHKENSQPVFIMKGYERIRLIDYLNENYLSFHTVDQSLIRGGEIFPSTSDFLPFQSKNIEIVQWTEENVDIETEFGRSKSVGKKSIHDFLGEILTASDSKIVFYDHGTGEIADFVTITRSEKSILISLYHVKKSGGQDPGERVNDVYEVCGQAVKSTIWLNKNLFIDRIHYRLKKNHPFLKGDIDLFTQVINGVNLVPTEFEIVVVQPGIQQSSLPDKISTILASTTDYIVRAGYNPLRVIASS